MKEKRLTVTTTKKQEAQLEKVYSLYADNTAQQTAESKAAYSKLQQLCKKYNVDFEAFLASKQQTATTDKKAENTQSDTQQTENTQQTASNEATKHFLRSRRAFIIEKLSTCLYDKKTLAEEIALFFAKYDNLKRNLQAVSGTIYDLQQNYNADIVVCEADSRVLLRSFKRKRS